MFVIPMQLFGNTVKGEAREFTSGKYGWYAGGKIEVEVNGKTIWGMSCPCPFTHTR